MRWSYSGGEICCVGCRGRYYPALERKHKGCVVVHSPEIGSPQAELVVVHSEPVVVHKSRHGVYRDVEARRRYKRDWMARRRAEARKGV